MNTFNRRIARVVIVCTIGSGMPAPSLAGIVTTYEVQADVKRDQVKSFLDRADVRAQMQTLGVNPQAALARVDALSDDEVASLAGRLDQLPAGGTDIVGALLLIFIVLLITDILGFTKVFPFTRPVK